MNEAIAEINALLARAGSEINAPKARADLARAKTLAEQLPDEAGLDGKLLQSVVYAECAIEETNPKVRGDFWRRCLKSCVTAATKYHIVSVADKLAINSVDCFQDGLSNLEQDEKLKFLTKAKSLLDQALKFPNAPEVEATLLARKSSVMRHQTFGHYSWSEKRKVLGECVRCMERARKLSADYGVMVESGQACWLFARHEDDDAKYAARLREAADFLTRPAKAGDDFAQLTLARFYRLNFDPLGACQTYPNSFSKASHLRKRLRDSYVFGEAAVQLWYQEYPEEVVRPFLLEAKRIMETALSAGYKIARIAVSLAFVTALLDGTRDGEEILSEMFGDLDSDPWSSAAKMIADPPSSAPLAQGIALGIDQPEIWQSLGTFARRLLNNDSLAEAMYRRSLALNDRNPIALTNLARILIDRSAFSEARRALDKARTFSDRRFFWWRTVLDELVVRESGDMPEVAAFSTHPQALVTPLSKLSEVTARFSMLKAMDDHEARGYLLEELLVEVARMSLGLALPRYRLKPPGVARPEIDLYFEHRGIAFRGECKWRREPFTPTQIYDFARKLDVANIHGFVLSMSGYSAAAIEVAREVSREHPLILMDGSEADLVFRGRVRLDAVISKKLSHLMQHSESYIQITADHFG